MIRTQRSNTGPVNGSKPGPSAMTTEDMHSSNGMSAASSSPSACHLPINGGMSVLISAGSLSEAPTLSASVPMAS